MRLVRVRENSGPVRVEYIAPPVPELPEPAQGEAGIQLPTERQVQNMDGEGKATPVTTMTLEGGFNLYLERAEHDWTAAERYAEAITRWLEQYPGEYYLGLPKSEHADLSIWVTSYTLTHIQGLHDQITVSPLARPKVGQQGGKIITVPGIVGHGPGKRGH